MQCAQKSAKLVIKNHKNNIITIILLLRLAIRIHTVVAAR